jgi:FAD/FMN-containing dehydrogenase
MCTSREDIAAAIVFARRHDLPIAVRGGGHSAAGLGVCDGGLQINLRLMNQVHVDPARRVAVAGAGATWGEFDPATQEYGLATTGGAITTTGIAGLTLGGGLGWLMRSRGLTIDNLLAADLVTADGEFVRASETENPELFWGLRGGGGNFGVVSSFEYRLHPLTEVLGGIIVHRFERCRELLRLYRELTQAAPDELTIYAGTMHVDGAVTVALPLCYAGPPSEGERLIAPLRAFHTPVSDTVAPMTYTAVQKMLTEDFPYGRMYYRRSNWITALDDGVIEAVEASSTDLPEFTTVFFEHAGGAVQRVPADATSFGHRDKEYDMLTLAGWHDPADAEGRIAWTREAWAHPAVTAVTRGVYVNYLGFGEGQDRVREAYGAHTYDRLVTLKRQYDPENVFHLNPNIDPRGEAAPATAEGQAR